MKQLLMVAGVEKYFQIARCFRDEDLRADRQPEFTQLDLEMSFVDQEDILRLAEELYTGMIETVAPQKKLTRPFPRLTHQEALARYGSDKPDLRFGLELTEVTDLAEETGFRVFQSTIEGGGIIKGLVAPGLGQNSGSDMRRLEETARGFGAAGLSHLRFQGTGSLQELTEEKVLLSPGIRMPLDWSRRLGERMGASPGDLVLLMAGPRRQVDGWPTRMRWPSPSLPDFPSSNGTRTRTGGTRRTIPSPRRPTGANHCWILRTWAALTWAALTWAALNRRLMIWSATVPNWPAAASGSTGGNCRRRFFGFLATLRSRSRIGSVIFWKPSNTAHRPTVESRRGLTVW
jgi:hypothetical protein